MTTPQPCSGRDRHGNPCRAAVRYRIKLYDVVPVSDTRYVFATRYVCGLHVTGTLSLYLTEPWHSATVMKHGA